MKINIFNIILFTMKLQQFASQLTKRAKTLLMSTAGNSSNYASCQQTLHQFGHPHFTTCWVPVEDRRFWPPPPCAWPSNVPVSRCVHGLPLGFKIGGVWSVSCCISSNAFSLGQMVSKYYKLPEEKLTVGHEDIFFLDHDSANVWSGKRTSFHHQMHLPYHK